MLYLILSILSASTISITIRFSKNHVKNKVMMFLTNYVVCMICSIFFLTNINSIPKEELSFPIWFGIIMGFFYLVTFLFYEFNIRKNGVILSNIFSKLGTILPVIVTFVFFNEAPKPLKIIGIVLAVIAVVIMNLEFKKKTIELEEDENKKEDTTINVVYIFLIIFFLLSGVTDSATTIFNHMSIPELNGFFLLFVFGSAFIFALILLIIKHGKISIYDVLFGVIIGVPNYFSSFFTLKALETVPAQIVYPTFCVGTIMIVTLFGVLAFKERLKLKDYIGILIIIAALILLNI